MELHDYYSPYINLLYKEDLDLASDAFAECRLGDVVFIPLIVQVADDAYSIAMAAYRRRIRLESVRVLGFRFGDLESDAEKTLVFRHHPLLPCMWTAEEIFPSVPATDLARMIANGGITASAKVSVKAGEAEFEYEILRRSLTQHKERTGRR
jgi:hypothetical protein